MSKKIKKKISVSHRHPSLGDYCVENLETLDIIIGQWHKVHEHVLSFAKIIYDHVRVSFYEKKKYTSFIKKVLKR